MSNPHEWRARNVKAERICAEIRKLDGTVADAESMTDEDWQNAAKLAGVREPSEATRQLIIRMLGE